MLKPELLRGGMTINIVEDTEVIDEVRVLRVGRGGVNGWHEIEVESLKLKPGRKIEFTFIPHGNPCDIPEGWRVLFEDPMTGERCYSQRAPAYVLEAA